MRRSEILGLRWQDVDLKAGAVTVRQTLLPGGIRWRPENEEERPARPFTPLRGAGAESPPEKAA